MKNNIRYEHVYDPTSNLVYQQLFKEYFMELGIVINERNYQKIFKLMKAEINLTSMQVLMIYMDDKLLGFSSFQVDKDERFWYIKMNNGDIREFYIKEEYRNKGYARILFNAIKDFFIENSMDYIYLTSEEGIDFWKHLGFVIDDSVMAENNLTVLRYDIKNFESKKLKN